MLHRSVVRISLSLAVAWLTILPGAFSAVPEHSPSTKLSAANAGVGGKAVDADELAKQLSNPVASLISVPFQVNYDTGYDSGGWRSTTNVQPVMPFTLNESWNLIQRVILPVIVQEDVGVAGSEAGLGDTTATSFFSPKTVGPS